MNGKIVIRGARVHNLKNLDLEIPRGRLVVVTGVSGSGKSSLAFDLLYAEGQRRYIESLSADTRQFLRQLEKPDVDSVEGLSPAVAIQARHGSYGPRSTVGTATEIADFLRLLFARAAQPSCVRCGREVSALTIEEVCDRLLEFPAGARIVVLAPVRGRSARDFQAKLRELARAGFTRISVHGEIREISEDLELGGLHPPMLDLVVDRLTLREGIGRRLADSLETASRAGEGMIRVQVAEGTEPARVLSFSQRLACTECGTTLPELHPQLFSFNSPQGACPRCRGLGFLPAEKASRTGHAAPGRCPQCEGARLKPEALAVRLAGKNIAEICSLSIVAAQDFFDRLQLAGKAALVAGPIAREISRRLGVLERLGLPYLSLDRPSDSLSGGEAQRVRLATQIGAGLAGVLYILDEPSIGLHQRDNAALLELLRQLRDAGNSVIVVEHDPEAMLAADTIVDMGPGAGADGGRVVAVGTPRELMGHEESLTGQFLSGRRKIPLPEKRSAGTGAFLTLAGVRRHNLKSVTVSIPIGALTCVTGVSGSGKSTLVMDVLYPAVARRLRRIRGREDFAELNGWENFERVVAVDQSPIGRTPRSNPATYIGAYDPLRELFARLPEARVRGYDARRFSFNSPGGRCEACAGEGLVRVEMHFLPDVFVSCDVCRGRRYNRETLEIRFKGLSIADVLDLTVAQALELLANIPAIAQKLRTLAAVGLGYLKLGQPAHTLSGGEAQRVKLAKELARKTAGRSLYLLDEPTSGLHFADVEKLLEMLRALVGMGNTVVVIEHNLDVIKSADYVIDLGPEGGERGGEVVAAGTPEEVARSPGSHTGAYLARYLQAGPDG
ncbi:MAG TPA: excinuclease ABC subunit UvrA [candidate division Zixibacteria bacterium]|nr:excinuclease ABC subunit UvrA [candidate division Zixibacteria bacterium]